MSRLNQDPSDIRRVIYRKATTIILILAVMAFLLGLNARDPAEPVRAPVEGLSAKALNIASLPVRGFENLVSAVSGHFGTVKKNKVLNEQVERLTQLQGETLALRAQVDYLETLLDIDIAEISSEDHIFARSVSEVNGPFVHSSLINAGANKGVYEGYAVMTTRGMFGRIVRSGQSSSRVLRLTDLNSRIPVMSSRSSGRAIMFGTNGPTPTLTFFGSQDWQIGDVVISSGDDGILPRGLNIGRVIAGRDSQFAVELDTGSTPVDWVWIIPFTPISTPEVDPVVVSESPESEASEPQKPLPVDRVPDAIAEGEGDQ